MSVECTIIDAIQTKQLLWYGHLETMGECWWLERVCSAERRNKGLQEAEVVMKGTGMIDRGGGRGARNRFSCQNNSYGLLLLVNITYRNTGGGGEISSWHQSGNLEELMEFFMYCCKKDPYNMILSSHGLHTLIEWWKWSSFLSRRKRLTKTYKPYKLHVGTLRDDA